MSLTLHAHPFSSYCQKVLIALYESNTPFSFSLIEGAEGWQLLQKLWAHRKMPVLQDGQKIVVESSIIIDYLAQYYPGKQTLIPANPDAAREVRFMDRYFDLYVMTPMNRIVADYLRPEAHRNPDDITQAKEQLNTTYSWLNERLTPGQWACGEHFSLADCAAAPSLFYADWVHEIPETFATLRGYRQALLSRPSMVRAVDEARPYRHYFPPGAPDRD